MSPDQNSPDIKMINQVNRELESAMRSGSAERLVAIYSNEGKLLPPNNRMVSGPEDIMDYWYGVIHSGITDAELTTEELDVYGETAVEVGSYVMQAGSETADMGKYVVIWKNENGQWKYHRDIWNSNLIS
jgi:ketosteroid isomerase-like protein